MQKFIKKNFNEELPQKYFRGDKRFPYCREDYSICGLVQEVQSKNLIFMPDYTNFGILLMGTKKKRQVEIAVLGFNCEADIADCLEIHGARGMYAQLSPVWWDGALLYSAIEFSKSNGGLLQ